MASSAGPQPSFFGSSSSFPSSASFNMEALKDFSSLSPSIQSHLSKVYLTLSAALIVASLGAYAHFLWGLGGAVSSVVSIGGVLWINATPATKANESLRLRLLLVVSFSHGCSVGPLVAAAAGINASLIAVALSATSAVFLSFSLAALVAPRREFLFLGGLLSAGLSATLAMHVAAWLMGPSIIAFYVELYFGLLLFCGYIIFDTQIIVERAARGSRDYVVDALELMMDFVAVFVRILVILMRSKRDEEQQERTARRKTGASTSRR